MQTLDNTIKFSHLMFKISLDNISEVSLPEGYSFAFYQDGDEKSWIDIEVSSNEAINVVEGQEAWNEYYAINKDKLYDRLLFIVDNNTNEKIATATAYFNTWTNDEKEGFLHFVAIKKEYQGKKLAKSLITHTLNQLKKLGYKEAFISTQTTTWLAAKLYLDLGAYPYELVKEKEGLEILKTIIGNHEKLTEFNTLSSYIDETKVKIKDILSQKYNILSYKVYDVNNPKVIKIRDENQTHVFHIDEIKYNKNIKEEDIKKIIPTVHMLVGIPGSGKSTYCNNHLIKKYPKAIFIASDIVRNNNPKMKEEEIWPEIYRLCSMSLKAGKDIIYDATNITPNVRDRFFNKLLERGVVEYNKIAYFFPTNPKICEERVTIRNTMPNERFLPVEVIAGYGEKIIAPTKEEGFIEIVVVDNNKHEDNYNTINFKEREKIHE